MSQLRRIRECLSFKLPIPPLTTRNGLHIFRIALWCTVYVYDIVCSLPLPNGTARQMPQRYTIASLMSDQARLSVSPRGEAPTVGTEGPYQLALLTSHFIFSYSSSFRASSPLSTRLLLFTFLFLLSYLNYLMLLSLSPKRAPNRHSSNTNLNTNVLLASRFDVVCVVDWACCGCSRTPEYYVLCFPDLALGRAEPTVTPGAILRIKNPPRTWLARCGC